MLYRSKFWKNIQNDNIELHKIATLSEPLAEKLRKHELDLKFWSHAVTQVYSRNLVQEKK